jgi:hypothetical protein
MNFQGNFWGAVIAVVMLANTWINIRNGKKVDGVHQVINSQLTAERAARNDQEAKLVEATQRAAKAEGYSAGLAAQKKED